MSKSEITGIFQWNKEHWMPYGLNLYDKLWWRFMPGVIIKLPWPCGEIVAGPGPGDPRWVDLGGAAYVKLESADPNDHYRPWLEQHVGRQGWDWNWGMSHNDVVENQLTLKIRNSRAQYATIAAMRWA